MCFVVNTVLFLLLVNEGEKKNAFNCICGLRHEALENNANPSI